MPHRGDTTNMNNPPRLKNSSPIILGAQRWSFIEDRKDLRLVLKKMLIVFSFLPFTLKSNGKTEPLSRPGLIMGLQNPMKKEKNA